MNYSAEVNHLLIGDYAEVGVYKGDHAALISKWMNPQSILWLFDSFKGHGEPSIFDRRDVHYKGRYSDTDIDLVRSKISEDRQSHVSVIEGWVPESLEVIKDHVFRFVRIDMDHYAPTISACEFFKSRMVSGGIMEFDDYLVPDCPGATQAVNEVFGDEVIVLRQSYSWIAP